MCIFFLLFIFTERYWVDVSCSRLQCELALCLSVSVSVCVWVWSNEMPETAENRELRLVKKGWGKIPAGRHRMRIQDSVSILGIQCRSLYVCEWSETINNLYWGLINVLNMPSLFIPEQRNFLLLICPIRLLASRRGLVQRAPLVSMGLSCR